MQPFAVEPPSRSQMTLSLHDSKFPVRSPLRPTLQVALEPAPIVSAVGRLDETPPAPRATKGASAVAHALGHALGPDLPDVFGAVASVIDAAYPEEADLGARHRVQGVVGLRAVEGAAAGYGRKVGVICGGRRARRGCGRRCSRGGRRRLTRRGGGC